MNNTTREMLRYSSKLVRVGTAFNSWGDMVAAMSTGYVPTIHGITRRERLLIKIIKANGYRVWGNAGKNW